MSSHHVVVTNSAQDAVRYVDINKVFFINPETHSDAFALIAYGEGKERVLFVNARLALTVELD